MSVDPQFQQQPQQFADPQKTDINGLRYALDLWEVYARENLSEGMRKAFMQMFDRSANAVDKKNSKDNQLAAFQRELQRIPEMTTGQLSQLLQDVSSFFDKDFNLKKTIKNIFLHRTMIASGIRPQSKANQRFDVPLPNPETLIHRAMSISAVSLFQWPSLFDRSPKTNTEENRLKKFNKVQSIIESAINKAIVQLMPYGELQDAYLGDTQTQNQGQQGQPVPPPAASLPQPVEEVIPKQTEVAPPQQQQPEYDPESKAGFKTSSKHSSKFQSGKKQPPNNSDEEDDEDDDESGSGSGSDDDDDDDQDAESQGDDQTEDEEPQNQKQKQKQNNKRKLEPEPKHSSSKKSDKKSRKF